MIGVDYRYNAGGQTFPDRLTFVAPTCASLSLPGTELELEPGAAVAWTQPDDDGAAMSADPSHPLRCPAGYVVVGFDVTTDARPEGNPVVVVRSLSLDCAPLSLNAETSEVTVGSIVSIHSEGIAPRDGVLAFPADCPDARVAAGIVLHSDSFVEDFGLQCASLTWPFAAGHGCATQADCQSNACDERDICSP